MHSWAAVVRSWPANAPAAVDGASRLNPLYVDTAIRRWQKYTGDQAINVATGRTFADYEAEVAHV